MFVDDFILFYFFPLFICWCLRLHMDNPIFISTITLNHIKHFGMLSWRLHTLTRTLIRWKRREQEREREKIKHLNVILKIYWISFSLSDFNVYFTFFYFQHSTWSYIWIFILLFFTFYSLFSASLIHIFRYSPPFFVWIFSFLFFALSFSAYNIDHFKPIPSTRFVAQLSKHI